MPSSFRADDIKELKSLITSQFVNQPHVTDCHSTDASKDSHGLNDKLGMLAVALKLLDNKNLLAIASDVSFLTELLISYVNMNLYVDHAQYSSTIRFKYDPDSSDSFLAIISPVIKYSIRSFNDFSTIIDTLVSLKAHKYLTSFIDKVLVIMGAHISNLKELQCALEYMNSKQLKFTAAKFTKSVFEYWQSIPECRKEVLRAMCQASFFKAPGYDRKLVQRIFVDAGLMLPGNEPVEVESMSRHKRA